MVHDDQRGLRVALEEALDRQAGSPPAAPTQLALLDEVGVVNHKGNAGKGRPPGRRNRRTEEWLEYFSKYPSPIELLLRTAAAPLDEFSRELGCSKQEAIKLQIAAATAAAPFLHPRLSAIELHPPGHPDGMPSTLTLQPQESAVDVSVVEDVVVDAGSVAMERPSSMSALSLVEDENGNFHRAPSPEEDVDPPLEVSTLSVRALDDGQGQSDGGSAPDPVENAVNRALSALVELANSDPRRAERIRRHLAEVFASTDEP
jgi:hypothetical protein